MDDSLTKEQQIELAWAQHLALVRAPYRSVLTFALRDRLAESQNWRCCYCGIRMEGTSIDWDAPTFEHIVPTSKGGGGEVDNIAISCRRCNEGRGNGDAP